MSVSANSFKKIQNVQDAFDVVWEQNTIVNIGQKHIALYRKDTTNPAVVELPPMPARYINLQDVSENGAGRFESEDLKKKFQVQFRTGTPKTLSLASHQIDHTVNDQKDAIRVLQEIDDMCFESMWKANILKKKKDTIRRALKKQGAEGDELERMAIEMFKDQGQSGVVVTDDGTYDIKTKMPAYRRVEAGSDETTVRNPVLMHKNIDGNISQVNYEDTKINRDAFIAAQVRIKPYVTPNGAYGTTYTYVAGFLIANGPEYSKTAEFSSFDYLMSSTAEPPKKKSKAN